jgi:hemerythrin-like metal-binding protein
MPLLNWNESYSVKIAQIDLQHKKLVEIVNDLHESMKAGKSKEVLGKILDELINYTANHFKTEEDLFDKYGYPDNHVHKRQHSDLVDQVLKFKSNFVSGKSVISIDLMNFLRDWLTQHIVGSDKKYSSFLNSKGVV